MISRSVPSFELIAFSNAERLSFQVAKTRLHDTMIFWKQIVRMQIHKRLNSKDLAPRARFELATLRLTAEMIENLSALFGVAYDRTILNPDPQLGNFGQPVHSISWRYPDRSLSGGSDRLSQD